MNEDAPIHPLKITFSSREACNCPLISVLLRVAKETEEKIDIADSSFLISARFGKRVIVNSSFSSFKEIKRDTFIEIIDYNFMSHSLFIIGQQSPTNEVLLHWLQLYAKNEISFIMEIKNASFTRCFISRYPTITLTAGQSQMDIVKSIMNVLQNNNIYIIDSSRMLITASSIALLEKRILSLIEKWRQIS
jgi:hypothetical protein